MKITDPEKTKKQTIFLLGLTVLILLFLIVKLISIW